MAHGQCEECGTRLYQAGERAPAGDYLRVDDGSYQRFRLPTERILPASFDGHIAVYRAAAAPCACERRQGARVEGAALRQRSRTPRSEPAAPTVAAAGDAAAGAP